MKLDATTDEDEQRVLEEDIAGKILWFCWCGICAEVKELLPKVMSYIWKEEGLKESITIHTTHQGLFEIGRIVGAAHVEPDDDQAHLRRIMLDAGVDTSKHQLLFATRTAEHIKWSGASISMDTTRYTQVAVLEPSTSAGNTAVSTVALRNSQSLLVPRTPSQQSFRD